MVPQHVVILDKWPLLSTGKVDRAKLPDPDLQLVSDRVTVYSPTKKIFYTEELILKEFGVTSNNFLMQKMLLGDSGDNVPGVSKLGPKTLLKEFPELGNNTIFTLQEVLEKCKLGTKQVHQNIINFKIQRVL